MYDWQRVEGATSFPFRCITCATQKDVLDTGTEVEHAGVKFGHVYLCKNCARTAARLFGFSKGKEQDRLSNAATVLEDLEKQVAESNKERETLGNDLLKAELRIESLLKEKAQLEGRVKQLQSRIAEEARAALELVGGDAA